MLKIGDHVIEDGSWLKQENDCAHISIAELEAIMKGINLALKWNVKKLLIVTDSVVVHGWLTLLKTRKSQIKVTGMSEILVRRRLAMIDSISIKIPHWSVIINKDSQVLSQGKEFGQS